MADPHMGRIHGGSRGSHLSSSSRHQHKPPCHQAQFRGPQSSKFLRAYLQARRKTQFPSSPPPSGKYIAYLLRRETAPGAGGFGNDFCYIQVQDTSTEQSMWESECAPVSTANTCAVVFDDNGLEVFDGSNSAWATDDAESANEDFLQTLELAGGRRRHVDPRQERRAGVEGKRGSTCEPGVRAGAGGAFVCRSNWRR